MRRRFQVLVLLAAASTAWPAAVSVLHARSQASAPKPAPPANPAQAVNPAQAQSPALTLNADELVARNIRAIGGLDRIHAMRTVKQTAHVTVPGMAAATLTLYSKRPNFSRQELVVAGNTITYGYDGTTAWSIDPTSGSTAPAVLTGPPADAIKQQSEFESPLVDYKAKGSTVTLVGPDTTAGKTLMHLTVTDSHGVVRHCYLDPATGLETKIVSDTPLGPVEQQLSDYRTVQGVQFPFVVRTVKSGASVLDVTIDKIEVDLPMDDALFRMPVKLNAARR